MPIATHAVAARLSTMLAKAGKLFLDFLRAIVEARRQRALMEAERLLRAFQHSSSDHGAQSITR